MMLNLDCLLGLIRYDLPAPVRSELGEGLGFAMRVVRQAHERSNELFGLKAELRKVSPQ